ncbi:MAG: histidine--tRNA ligase [Candidatus Paceibacterota bacterium]|jgi:histidyl-tRNA synthetase
MINSQPPSGMRDTLPNDLRKKEQIINQIKQIFEKFNYDPIDTPVLERIEVLNGKFSSEEENEKLIFQIQKRGDKSEEGSDLGLRYDLTVPLARFYVEYKDKLPKVFKRYCINKAWRAERAGRGRFREFYQCDIDTINSDSNLVEVETFLVLNEALKCFNLKNLSLKISSRDFLLKFLESFQIEDIKSFMTVLDKQDKIGFDGVLDELVAKGFDQAISKNILDLLQNEKEFDIYCQNQPEIQNIINQIQEIIDLAKPFLGDTNIFFCKTLVRGFAYYTSTVFEFYSQDLESTIAGGGRYDKLTNIFNNDKIPACGGSIGLERIFGLMENQGTQNQKNSVLIALFDDTMKADCVGLLKFLTDNNINSEIYLSADKLGDQIKYALSKNCKYLIIYGPDEKAKGVLTVKNLISKEQIEVKKDDLLASLKF